MMVPDWLFLTLIAVGLWFPLTVIGWCLAALGRALFHSVAHGSASRRPVRFAGEGLVWTLWVFVGFPAFSFAALWFFLSAGDAPH